MVATGKGLLSPRSKPTHQQQVSIFKKRQTQVGMDWQNVNWVLWMQLLSICITENIGVGIYSASGGRGICLKLYTGKKNPDVEYAGSAEELNELLDGAIDNLGYKLEDGKADLAAD